VAGHMRLELRASRAAETVRVQAATHGSAARAKLQQTTFSAQRDSIVGIQSVTGLSDSKSQVSAILHSTSVVNGA
jgi:hypothetical protein